MKKKIISLIALMLVIMTGSALAASYTLPEKMSNQLAIGSGLKGTFTVSAKGDQFQTPFLQAVTDAEFSIRGISSGKDFHYYVFQTDDQENQSALSELYRKDGTCYFRSDMVQGKILSLPTAGQFLDALFPATGENGSASPFVNRIISIPEDEKKEKLDPVLNHYQNELELWLADFTVNADTVKLDSGFSALDFTYVIPIDKVIEKTVSLYDEITSDPEAVALLSSLMTEEEEKIYLNRNLLTFYQEALNSLKLDQPVRMNKRVSAMGDLLRFRLELPLDERTAGYSSLAIETIDRTTVYTLKKEGQIIVLGIPGAEELKKQEFDQSVWYANIITEGDTKEHEGNCAVRINIKKTFEMHEEDEKSHETDHYTVSVVQDTSFLPDETDLTLLPEFTEISIEADLHYSSKFAQNSATNLDIEANLTKGDSSIRFEGNFKTAAPWLFMPFEVIDPVVIGTKKDEVLIPYITDWISNAASMIRHTAPEAEELPEVSENHAESAAEIPAGEAYEDEAAGKDTDTGTEDTDAEAQPMDEEEIP